MIFPRHALVLSTLLLTAFANPTPQLSDSAVDWDLFYRLVDNVDEGSIHSILHKLAPKFQHGVFSKDRSAIEQVHSENPPLATSLLSLAKRASNTSTTTIDASAASSSVTSVESSLASVASSLLSAQTSLSSVQSSVASAAGGASSAGGSTDSGVSSAASSANSQAAAQSSQQASLTSAQGSLSSELAASSARTASTLPVPTSLALAPTTPKSATPVSTINGGVVYSSAGGGLVTVASSIAFVTYQRSSQEILSTFTLPNGQLTTATSVVIVNAPVTGSLETAAGTAGAAQTTGSGAGLQSGAASASQGHLTEIALMLGGAVLVAVAL